jgi:major type 1 subunit fimbrin (pilin)
MKKILLASLIVTASTASFAVTGDTPAATATVTNVNGGKVTINGEITAGACAISSDDANKVVTLDTIPSNKFTAANQVADTKKQFTITLVDCDTSAAKTVNLTFTGMSDSTIATALANTAGAGAAKNVAVQLYQDTGAVLPLNTATRAYDIASTVPMLFAADYISTAEKVTAGKVLSVANFQLSYQ